MKQPKRYLVLDSFEWRLAIAGMNGFRSHPIRAGKPAEDANTLLFKPLKAKSIRRFRRNLLQRRTSCAANICGTITLKSSMGCSSMAA
jgi:hypothetical protein